MKYKICLLGTENAQNTKLLVMEMHGKGIKFSIALQKQNTIIAFEKSTYRYVTTYISEILKKINYGPLKALSPIHPFYWKK